MKKVYHLSTCSTCKRILKEANLESKGFELQDIKSKALTEAQVDQMAVLTGSYEALFSRKSRKYAEYGLKDKNLTEEDYRSLILKEYTFLKRPVVIDGQQIFVGNSKQTIEEIITST
ncbi:MAG: ArsC/Spx/MgsR family protein [Cyclobacteriaceae bacterium]